jgi:chromosome segregation ATPase
MQNREAQRRYRARKDEYCKNLENSVRGLVEKCDTLQGFYAEHSEKISQLVQKVEQLESIQSRMSRWMKALTEISSFWKNLDTLLNGERSN